MDVVSLRGASRLLTIALSLVLLSVSVAHAGECVKGEAILRNKHREFTSKSEIQSLEKAIILRDSDEKNLRGSNKFVKSLSAKASRVVCEENADPCAKLTRNARKAGYISFVRSKHFLCSANYIMRTSVNPNDQFFGLQDELRAKKYSVQAPRAWNTTQGSASTIVAIIDTGVDYTHPDLAANIRPDLGTRFSSLTGNKDPMDGNGHGTHVAGTIGAIGNNGIGIAGINWNVTIIPVAFLDSDGSGTLFDAVQALQYVYKLKVDQGINIRLTNNSWGGGSYSTVLADAINQNAAAGILFVAAAGNEANNNDKNPAYPASYPIENVISVAATDTDASLAYFSNYGRNTVHVAAPGVKILSTYPGGQYAYLSGTSMATPHVSGALALLASANPGLSAAELRANVLATANPFSKLKHKVEGMRFLRIDRTMVHNTSQAKPKKK